MKTEFLIPFEIDTSAIEEKLKAGGYEEVMQRLTGTLRAQVESSLPKRYGTIDWDRVAWNAIEKFLDKHADEIIDTTVLLLAEKVGNRKRWRDVLKEIKEERKEG
jgi:hypothetical protein